MRALIPCSCQRQALGPRFRGGDDWRNPANLITAACAGTTNRVECRTLIFATRY